MVPALQTAAPAYFDVIQGLVVVEETSGAYWPTILKLIKIDFITISH
jgi:hypothetical protein